jgi:hypothetical protein
MNREKLAQLQRDAARDLLEELGYLVLPPDPDDLDDAELERLRAYLERRSS